MRLLVLTNSSSFIKQSKPVQACWIIFSDFWYIPCRWLFCHAILAVCHPLETLMLCITWCIIISKIASLQQWLKAQQCTTKLSITIMFHPCPPPDPDEIHNLQQVWKITLYPISFQLLLVLPLVFVHSNMLLILAHSFSAGMLIATLQWWLEDLRWVFLGGETFGHLVCPSFLRVVIRNFTRRLTIRTER